jgi:phosphoglycolate phosphatase
MHRILFFDLDGTLTRSDPGIVNAAAYALGRMGRKVDHPEELKKFIGPPILDSFENYYGMSAEEAEKALSFYREYYTRKGQYENSVYPGIPEMLETLRGQGKQLLVATSKPDFYTAEILRFLHLDRYFDQVASATMDGSRTEKIDVIRCAIELSGAERREDIVMVGDRKFDILGARGTGLDLVGVLYGYGSRRELEEAGAWRIAATVEELSSLLTHEDEK